MDIATLIIFYSIYEDLSVLTSFCGLILSVPGAGGDKVLAFLRLISDPVLVIVSDAGQSKDVGKTLGVVSQLLIPREVDDLIDGDSSSVTAEVYILSRFADVPN